MSAETQTEAAATGLAAPLSTSELTTTRANQAIGIEKVGAPATGIFIAGQSFNVMSITTMLPIIAAVAILITAAIRLYSAYQTRLATVMRSVFLVGTVSIVESALSTTLFLVTALITAIARLARLTSLRSAITTPIVTNVTAIFAVLLYSIRKMWATATTTTQHRLGQFSHAMVALTTMGAPTLAYGTASLATTYTERRKTMGDVASSHRLRAGETQSSFRTLKTKLTSTVATVLRNH